MLVVIVVVVRGVLVSVVVPLVTRKRSGGAAQRKRPRVLSGQGRGTQGWESPWEPVKEERYTKPPGRGSGPHASCGRGGRNWKCVVVVFTVVVCDWSWSFVVVVVVEVVCDCCRLWSFVVVVVVVVVRGSL